MPRRLALLAGLLLTGIAAGAAATALASIYFRVYANAPIGPIVELRSGWVRLDRMDPSIMTNPQSWRWMTFTNRSRLAWTTPDAPEFRQAYLVSWYRSPTMTSVRFMLWPWIPAAGLPGWLLLRRAKRPQPNTCPACRYDLSATPASAPCPECGRTPPTAP